MNPGETSDNNALERTGSDGQLERESTSEDTVLDQFKQLERDELIKYCKSISVDGVVAQTATLQFEPGQSMWTSKGTLIAYNEGIDWELKVPGGAGKAVSRALSGEGISLVRTTARAPGAEATIGSNQPGKLVTWDLSQGPITCTRGAFVGALGDVDIDVTTAKKAGAAFFGGAGLFLQKLSGDGIAIIHGSGDFLERRLDAGESILVSTGNLACFSSGVDYDIQSVGGCLKMIFGQEGMFMTKLTGPGWVMMQSLKKGLPSQQSKGSS